MSSRTLLRSGVCAAALAWVAAGAGVQAQPAATVFAPGTISKQGDNVYRGQFSADGKEFWFFRKVTPNAEDYRIYVSRRSAAGEWGEPERVSFGADSTSDLYPAPAPDGRRLVFSSYRKFPGDTSAHPNANLWYVERRASGWSAPVPMRGASVTANYDAGPWFDRAGILHWESISPDWRTTAHRQLSANADLASAPFESDPIAERWSGWTGHTIRRVVPSPDGSFAILDLPEEERRNASDLWISRRVGSAWSTPVKLGPEINTPGAYENFVVFSPDGKEMLFVRQFAAYYKVPVELIR